MRFDYVMSGWDGVRVRRDSDKSRSARRMAGGSCPHLFACLFPQQQISGDESKEEHGDHTIHGEERGIQFAEIV
jgi:hypothetical protein